MDTTPTTITAPAFSTDRVADVMSPGVLSCPPETPLRTAARMMATYQVHAIFVFASTEDHSPFWTVLTDLDLIAAALPDIERRTAGGTAHEHVVTVAADAPIARARAADVPAPGHPPRGREPRDHAPARRRLEPRPGARDRGRHDGI